MDIPSPDNNLNIREPLHPFYILYISTIDYLGSDLDARCRPPFQRPNSIKLDRVTEDGKNAPGPVLDGEQSFHAHVDVDDDAPSTSLLHFSLEPGLSVPLRGEVVLQPATSVLREAECVHCAGDFRCALCESCGLIHPWLSPQSIRDFPAVRPFLTLL